jgi:hypothetical protein
MSMQKKFVFAFCCNLLARTHSERTQSLQCNTCWSLHHLQLHVGRHCTGNFPTVQLTKYKLTFCAVLFSALLQAHPSSRHKSFSVRSSTMSMTIWTSSRFLSDCTSRRHALAVATETCR